MLTIFGGGVKLKEKHQRQQTTKVKQELTATLLHKW